MISKTAACAAACLAVSAAPAMAGYATGVDQVSLSKYGLLPNTGENYTPFWGGNTAIIIRDANGIPHRHHVDTEFRLDHLTVTGVLDTPFNTVLFAPGFAFSGATNMAGDDPNIGSGLDVVGFAGGSCSDVGCFGPHAVMWEGTGAFYDLHPSGYVASFAQGATAGGAVGWAQDAANNLHAMLWNITSVPQARELMPPPGFTQAAASAYSGNNSNGIGGYGLAANGHYHPLVWTVGQNFQIPTDMLPFFGTDGAIVAGDGLDTSGTFGGSIITVGSAGKFHAAIWPTPGVATCVDLHPFGAAYAGMASSVYALRNVGTQSSPQVLEVGLVQVRGRRGPKTHAMVWAGSAGSAIDLQTLLPAGFVQSTATGVDQAGNVTGAALDTLGHWHDIFWQHQ